MSNSGKTLVLIDGHSNLYKAYHAIREQLTNARGEPTSAIYGFISTFFRLQRQHGLQHVAVVFDAPGKSFRDNLFAEYKAHRPPTPDDLKIQYHRVKELLGILRVPMVTLDGFEADDALAALALRAAESGGEALVCSSDKDLLQIVRPGIKVLREHLQKTELLDEQGVFEKMGVRPNQIAAYLGIVGDTADNIPGVPGCGAKGAAKLLAEYGTIEAIIANADAVKPAKVAEFLRTQPEAVRLSEKLATLDTDCIASFDWDAFLWSYVPTPELREFYREMNFQSLLADLGGATVEERTVDYRVLRTRAELEDAASAIRSAGEASIDTETTDLDALVASLVGISISWATNQAVYLPVGHGGSEPQLALDDVRAVLGPLLSDPAIRWVAHNWNYDCKILGRAGFPPCVIAGDSMIAGFLLAPDRSNSLRLKEMAVSLLGIKMTEISELIGGGDDMVTMAGVTIEDSGRYACQDADATLQLCRHLAPKVAEAGMDRLYREVELPLESILAEMEMEGVRIDRDHFQRLSKEAERELARHAEEIHRIAGRFFNINSPKQVGAILFDELKLPTGKKGKSGTYSTDVSVLEELEDKHPLPRKLLEFRQVEKLRNTYLEPLPGMVHPQTGRLHTSFNQTIAATGRLSSSNPNLQNIPIRTEAGRRIREGFLPRADGWVLVSADYSQIELRILAHLSGDEALREAFRTGGDVHTLTASKVFGIPEAEVSSAMRGQAKAINFGIIYGMSDFRLSKDLGISRAEAKRFIDDYFRIYSGVARFIEETKEAARRDGYVTTLLGRRRFVSDINARNANQRNFAERIAVNTPIQGTSADMIKAAMLRIAPRIKAEGLASRMILQVHDELIFDTPLPEVDRLTILVRDEMANALPLDVPIRVDVSVGENWARC